MSNNLFSILEEESKIKEHVTTIVTADGEEETMIVNDPIIETNTGINIHPHEEKEHPHITSPNENYNLSGTEWFGFGNKSISPEEMQKRTTAYSRACSELDKLLNSKYKEIKEFFKIDSSSTKKESFVSGKDNKIIFAYFKGIDKFFDSIDDNDDRHYIIGDLIEDLKSNIRIPGAVIREGMKLRGERYLELEVFRANDIFENENTYVNAKVFIKSREDTLKTARSLLSKALQDPKYKNLKEVIKPYSNREEEKKFTDPNNPQSRCLIAMYDPQKLKKHRTDPNLREQFNTNMWDLYEKVTEQLEKYNAELGGWVDTNKNLEYIRIESFIDIGAEWFGNSSGRPKVYVDPNERKQAASKARSSFIKHMKSSKHKDIAKGLAQTNDSDEFRSFLKGDEHGFSIGRWDIWEMVRRPRDDDNAREEAYKKIDDFCRDIQKDVSMEGYKIESEDGDWDGGVIELVCTKTVDQAVEGLGDVITGIVVGTLNTLLHLTNTFKTNILGAFKTLKRTELRYYHEANTISVQRILNRDYTEVSGMKIWIPRGMSSTYLVTTKSGLELLDALDMENRSKELISKLEMLFNEIKRDNVNMSNGSIQKVDNLKVLLNLFNIFNKHMTGFKEDKRLFKEVFTNMHEFSETDRLLLSGEKHQINVQTVYNNLQECTNITTEILAYVQSDTSNTNLKRDDFLELYKTTMSMAKLFDMYGLVIKDMNRIEHNFVVVMQDIRKEFRL